MRTPHIITSLGLFFFLSLILQSHQQTIDRTQHIVGNNVNDQQANNVAVTLPERRRKEIFNVLWPITTWRKEKIYSRTKRGDTLSDAFTSNQTVTVYRSPLGIDSIG
ncbi:hypothetical protein YC2023_025921 [Brassica napus]